MLLGEVFGHEWTSEVVLDAYLDVVREFDDAAIEWSVNELIKGDRRGEKDRPFMPKPAELRAMCKLRADMTAADGLKYIGFRRPGQTERQAARRILRAELDRRGHGEFVAAMDKKNGAPTDGNETQEVQG